MNKTDQQKNNKYINYWTESGKSAKETNQAMKIATTISYLKEDKEVTYTAYRHPSLKDIKLVKPTVATTTPAKKSKVERFDKIPYSKLHRNMVSGLYGRENKIFKQQTILAAHESKIQNIMIEKKARKLNSTKRNLEDCPNLVVVERLNEKGVPYDFSITPSRKSLDELWKDAKEANKMFSKCMKGYFGISIWEKKEYIEKYMRNANYRYHVYAEKEETKLAA